MSDIVLLNVTVAAEMSSAKPNDKTMKNYLQQCIHISRQVLKGEIDLEFFEKFFTTRFPNEQIDQRYCEEWLNNFSKGQEWQFGDYQTRYVLQQIAPDIYPTDKDAYFLREVKGSK